MVQREGDKKLKSKPSIAQGWAMSDNSQLCVIYFWMTKVCNDGVVKSLGVFFCFFFLKTKFGKGLLIFLKNTILKY